MNFKFLHLMPASRYTIDYTNRINKVYNPEEHFFIIYNCKDNTNYNIINGIIVDTINFLTVLEVVKKSQNAKHVFLHSLYLDTKLLAVITILSFYMKKHFSWYIWGADLIYEHEKELLINGLMLKKRIKKRCRKVIIKNLYQIIAAVPTDYNYAFNAYKTEAKLRLAFYAYNLPKNLLLDKEVEDNNRILVGHSANPCYEHKKTFELIAGFEYDGEILSVLSYDGTEEYVESVLKEGKALFGSKFEPILNWMSYEDYMQLLNKIDCAVISGDRQCGVCNILSLLYLGKKVFLHSQNGVLDYLKNKGVKIYSIDELNKTELSTKLSEEDILRNKEVIGSLCSNENFRSEWNRVFDI